MEAGNNTLDLDYESPLYPISRCFQAVSNIDQLLISALYATNCTGDRLPPGFVYRVVMMLGGSQSADDKLQLAGLSVETVYRTTLQIFH